MSWFVEQFKLFGVDEVTEFILNLNNELDDIKTVKTVIGESTIKVDTGFFGGSEIALNKWQNVFLDLIVRRKDESIFLLCFNVFPHANLIIFVEFSWD